MNRRQFLQASFIIPSSFAALYLAKKMGALPCGNCLPLRITSQNYIISPTNTNLVSFSARKTNLYDYIRELWQKFFE